MMQGGTGIKWRIQFLGVPFYAGKILAACLRTLPWRQTKSVREMTMEEVWSKKKLPPGKMKLSH